MPQPRIASLDVTRGFALLGILTMNITLGLPEGARLNPEAGGGMEGANFWLWVAGYLLFDEKMITLFTLLFGAGICLWSETVGSTPNRFLGRQLRLLLIGLLHAYLVWEGDILVYYSLCGLMVYRLRHWPIRRLWWGAFLLALPSLLLAQFFAGSLPPGGLGMDAQATAQQIQQLRKTGWWELVVHRAPATLETETTIFLASFAWTICARMLAGMALWKMGFWNGRWTWKAALICYAVGWPLVGAAGWGLWTRHFDARYLFGFALHCNQWGSFGVALGHALLLQWIWRSGWLGWFGDALAAVGRLSLPNYLLQNIALTTIFYGYGLGQFARWDRIGLAWMVLAFWCCQLVLSWLWIRLTQR